MRATILRILPDRNFGFLYVPGQRDVFFDGSVVVGGSFSELGEGDLVEFEPGTGDKGPRALTLQLIAKAGDCVRADTTETGEVDDEEKQTRFNK